ncbi:hypothetical protein BUALT_Bualt05G0026400 [Buddleja alternifolia]|uniref:F-box associated beta-propeller type 3 domain-containing protein n=1 Tax=Buddleja alternifolia TaxID=168488 RepID=A0AAV6XRW5_9LAMI|nr:hypothetical protein BUALT_Bualt05G0026400 [Buddleja alternifolia]
MSSYGQRIRNYLSCYFIQDTKQLKYLSMFVSIDQSSSKICTERLPDDMRIIASSNQGILCCLRRRRSIVRYYACKPATKQWKSLPNPKLRCKTAAIAIMVLSSSPLRYKIVRLSRRGNVGSISKYKFEIFDSKIWSWKETQDVELPYYEVICSSNKAVSANNSVYWLTSHNNVLAFHEPEGTFQKFPLPEEVLQDKNKYSFKYKQLVEYKGRLGLVCNTKEGDTELWIMYENTINNWLNWRKEMVMDIGSIVRRVGMRYADVAGFYNEGIAF